MTNPEDKKYYLRIIFDNNKYALYCNLSYETMYAWKRDARDRLTLKNEEDCGSFKSSPFMDCPNHKTDDEEVLNLDHVITIQVGLMNMLEERYQDVTKEINLY
jgi:hypothetical protein